jgi:hypothetical protein
MPDNFHEFLRRTSEKHKSGFGVSRRDFTLGLLRLSLVGSAAWFLPGCGGNGSGNGESTSTPSPRLSKSSPDLQPAACDNCANCQQCNIDVENDEIACETCADTCAGDALCAEANTSDDFVRLRASLLAFGFKETPSLT